jgi:hypothetical protein
MIAARRNGNNGRRRRAIVVGGGGVTGRRIVERLRRSGLDVTVGSRSANEAANAGGSGCTVRIDISRPGAEVALRDFDLVVLALGPFDRLGLAGHRACLAAGVSCVDVNDCPTLTRDILTLDEEARGRGVVLATGMGLCPGLTTLLLLDAARAAHTAGPLALRTALLLGGDQDVGRASIATMLGGFHARVWELREGGPVEMDACDVECSSLHFPGGARSVPVFHVPLADAFTLGRAKGLPSIARCDLRAHFEGLGGGTVRFLRSNAGKRPAVQAALGALTNRLQPLARRSGRLQAHSMVWVFDRAATVSRVAAGMGSYDITAAVAATVSRWLCEGVWKPGPGARTPEDLEPLGPRLFTELANEGLTLRRSPEGADAALRPQGEGQNAAATIIGGVT